MSNGVYKQVEGKYYNLPTPQHMFDLEYFLSDQRPFYDFVTRELMPKPTTLPTIFHHFLKLLEDKGLLSRCYTQNIDALEKVAGISRENLYEVHGTLSTASCANDRCKRSCDARALMSSLMEGKHPKCPKCGSAQKPDIVFFGERMPRKVQEAIKMNLPDFRRCDLLIIAGTSLAVQPFASFIDAVPRSCPRVFINRSKDGSASVGEYEDSGAQHMYGKCGNYRDVLLKGDCDKVVTDLCKSLGWIDELYSNVTAFVNEGSLTQGGGGVDINARLYGAKLRKKKVLVTSRSDSCLESKIPAPSPTNPRRLTPASRAFSTSNLSRMTGGHAIVYP